MLEEHSKQKVIQLLQGMAEKGKKEKHEEQVQFAAYKQFCDDTTVEKQRAIKEATAKMEQLVAAIQKAEADAATLAKEIAQLDEDISVYEGDKKAATEVNRRFFFPPGEGPGRRKKSFCEKSSQLGFGRSSVLVWDWCQFFVSPDLPLRSVLGTGLAPFFRHSPDLPSPLPSPISRRRVLPRQPKPPG